MNILIICDLQPMGGSVTYTTNFITALQRLQHSVTAVSFSEIEYDLFPHSQYIRHKQLLVKKRYYKVSLFSRFRKLYHFLKKEHPKSYDLIISDYYLAAFSLLLCRLLLGGWKEIPFFYQFHGAVTLEQDSQNRYRKKKLPKLHYGINYLLEKACLSSADKIICFSRYSVSLVDTLFHQLRKAVLIPPGREEEFDEIRKDYTRQQARKELGLNQEKEIVFIASRLEPRKGVAEILKLLASEKEKFSNTLFLIATNLKDFTKELISIKDLDLFYIQLPSRKDLALFYRSADLTLMPSKKLETFGLTTLESLTMGTPVVAYDIGANKELVPDEYLASVSNPHSFLEKVILMMNKVNNAKQVEDECLKKAEQYSWEAYTNNVLHLLDSGKDDAVKSDLS